MQGIIIENIANLYRVKPIHQNEEKMSQENPEPVGTSGEKFPKETRNQWGKDL